MMLALSPSGIERFRESKQIQVGAQRMCKGPCKKRRSIAQFACGDELCITCRRRAPKADK